MKKTYYSLIVIVVVAAIGFGLLKSGAFTPKASADVALGQGIMGLANVTSDKAALDLSVTDYNDAPSNYAGTSVISVHLEGSGASTENNSDLRADYTLSGSFDPVPNISYNFEAQIRVVGEIVYLKMTKIPNLPNIPTTVDLSTISNLWFSVDPVSLAQKYGDAKIAARFQDLFGNSLRAKRLEHVAAIADIYQKHPFVVNAQYTTVTKIGEDEVRTITFSIDKNIFADFIIDADAYMAREVAHVDAPVVETKDEVMKLLDGMTFNDLSASVGISDHFLHAFSVKVHIQDPTDASKKSSADVAISGTFTDFNKPVVVAAPDSFLSLDKIIEMGMKAKALQK